MTHEPECPIGNSDDPLTFYAARQNVAIVCVCANIRAAYQRGREDAANAVENTMLSELDEPLTEYELAYVAAARGDGEQA